MNTNTEQKYEILLDFLWLKCYITQNKCCLKLSRFLWLKRQAAVSASSVEVLNNVDMIFHSGLCYVTLIEYGFTMHSFIEIFFYLDYNVEVKEENYIAWRWFSALLPREAFFDHYIFTNDGHRKSYYSCRN